jgi:hypothetical protein
MNWLILPLSLLCGLILSGTGICIFALYRAYCLLGEMKQTPARRTPEEDIGVQSLRETVEALAAQLHDLQNHPPVALAPGLPRPGLNLNKRSHALRLFRRGEGADQIATTLELPRQEVDLLLKVHRIVIGNL